MATTTMHFGPEWMRTKQQMSTARTQPHPPSPPPAGTTVSGASTYSALVSSAPPPQPENRDEAHPFRYSKYDLLRIYKEGGGKGGLGLEVERWEGVVREVGSEPVGLRDMGDAEKKVCVVVCNKNCHIFPGNFLFGLHCVLLLIGITTKLFSGPLNSELRRRQSADYLSSLSTQQSGERPRMNQPPSLGSPMRERFSSYMGKRRDSTG
jgi:PERQ amino acid-rich with GYF domain-containing protein